jgi:hypothetical protein
MSKIKLRIVEFEGNHVAIQILEMDERFREKEFKASNGITLSSSDAPCFDDDITTSFLRGRNTRFDLLLNIIYFNNKKDKDKYLKKLFIALIDWANNWEGFKNDEPTTKTDSTTDYIWEI